MNIDDPNFVMNYKIEVSKLASDIDNCFTGQPRAICLSALEVNIVGIIQSSIVDISFFEKSSYDERKQALHKWLDLFNNNILEIIDSI